MKLLDSKFLSEFRETNRCRFGEAFETLKESGWKSDDWSAAMIGEFGEAANEAKKLKRLDSGLSNYDRGEKEAALSEEVADTVIYSDLLYAHNDMMLFPPNSKWVAHWHNVIDKVGMLSAFKEAFMLLPRFIMYAEENRNRSLGDETCVKLMSFYEAVCQKCGTTLEDAVVAKFNKTSIKYNSQYFLGGAMQ